ncbi:MAG: DUF480 domain-containing protein [Pseudomonadota bacterium]
MALELNDVEARVLGCLLEKAVITPDQYPLTLNALVNACNQKSSREPVMQLDQGEVLAAARSLQDKHMIRSDENFRSQIEKFSHRFCNTPFSDYQLEPAQYSIVTVLLLRGPRTPGELRANSGRLHDFASNAAVMAALTTLTDGEQVIVEELPLTPGRRDSEYMHLFAAPARLQEVRDSRGAGIPSPRPQPSTPSPAPASEPAELADMQAQIDALKREVAALSARLNNLESESQG